MGSATTARVFEKRSESLRSTKSTLVSEGLNRRRWMTSAVVSLAGVGLGQSRAVRALAAAGREDDPDRLNHMDDLERYMAIDNKCAWPNLTLLPDDSIVATIFGQPCHGTCEGEAECWISRDGGRGWAFLSVPAPHEPGTWRGNLAAGLTPSGAFVVLCSGGSVPSPPTGVQEVCCLAPLVCHSTDGGKTWTRAEGLTMPTGVDDVIPFGDIATLPGGRLAVSAYSGDHVARNTAWVFFSDDDGRTWGDARVIGLDNYNETTLLSTGNGKLLAASRTLKKEHTEIFASKDSGHTWKHHGPVSLFKQCPAHLFRLQDGSILLTYGSRLRGALGVHARISHDEGLSWDAPRVLFSTTVRKSGTAPGGVDGGYPSSVQLKDGTIVTAYYCQRIPMHQRYHMGVVRWRVPLSQPG